ncbi:MAG TPA: hypothetical protein ENN99_07250 [Chloroflexi bacterium]|nr:hypothetical protein [Chloroflexota bacterium]
MADFELYEDDLYEDEEEIAEEVEGSNRTFMILVAALGGILTLGICAFIIWAFVLNPNMAANRAAENRAIEMTNEAILAVAEAGTETVLTAEAETPEPVAEATETVAPTDTPRPTLTSAPTDTPVLDTPGPEVTPAEGAEETPDEVAQAGTATPRPTATRRVTPTPTAAEKEKIPGTGIGVLGAGVIALGLLFLLAMVRRVRQTV